MFANHAEQHNYGPAEAVGRVPNPIGLCHQQDHPCGFLPSSLPRKTSFREILRGQETQQQSNINTLCTSFVLSQHFMLPWSSQGIDFGKLQSHHRWSRAGQIEIFHQDDSGFEEVGIAGILHRATMVAKSNGFGGSPCKEAQNLNGLK